jgi:hypothetical protein
MMMLLVADETSSSMHALYRPSSPHCGRRVVLTSESLWTCPGFGPFTYTDTNQPQPHEQVPLRKDVGRHSNKTPDDGGEGETSPQ